MQHLAAGAPRRGWAANAVRSLLAWAGSVGADPTDGSDTALQKRLMVALSVGLLPLTLLWSVIYFVAGVPFSAAIPAIYTAATPVNTLLFAWTRNLGFYRFTQLLMYLVLPWLLMMTLGGFRESSVVVIWAALCPLASLLIEDLRDTLLWILGFVALLALSAILQPYLTPAGLPEAFVDWFFVLNVGGVITIAFVLLYYFVGQRNFFQERSEMLLHNILPREISESLKAEQKTIAAQHDSASILFADVVGLTPMAATMTPLALVELLNEVFLCFDGLVENHALEKIKTIGDCYMVASGVPRSRPDHARVLVQLALENARGRRGSDLRRAQADLPDRHQFRAGGGRRDRPQEIHLRSVGRSGESREPHGIAWPGWGDPDHAQDTRSGREQLPVRSQEHDRREGRRPDGGLARDWSEDGCSLRSIG